MLLLSSIRRSEEVKQLLVAQKQTKINVCWCIFTGFQQRSHPPIRKKRKQKKKKDHESLTAVEAQKHHLRRVLPPFLPHGPCPFFSLFSLAMHCIAPLHEKRKKVQPQHLIKRPERILKHLRTYTHTYVYDGAATTKKKSRKNSLVSIHQMKKKKNCLVYIYSCFCINGDEKRSDQKKKLPTLLHRSPSSSFYLFRSAPHSSNSTSEKAKWHKANL